MQIKRRSTAALTDKMDSGSRKFRAAFATSSILPLATALLAIGIFIFDTITRLEIAAPILYVAVVLIAVNFSGTRGVILISAACSILTLLSCFLTETGSIRLGLINSAISIIAIGAAAYLALRTDAAQLVAQEARTQLAHIARVTTLGEMAASIAHEVNQPLGAIVANGTAAMNWLTATPPNLSETESAVAQIVDDANRASSIISRIRQLAKGAPAQQEWVDINSTILEVTSLMRHEIERSAITLRTQLSEGVSPIWGDRIQLQQVFLNIIINAIEALSQGSAPSREIHIRTAMEGSEKVLVSVADSGKGFEQDALDRLFEAFHTTKPQGMGIGLTISRSIVEFHGGRIEALANKPNGALIRFTLPVHGVS